jgi:phosphomannomutase
MEKALAANKRAVCGWEANGGFLTGSSIQRDGHTLPALPTRDAMLPILCALFSAKSKSLSLIDLFAGLPKRFSRAALLKSFPRPVGLEIVARFSPSSASLEEARFEEDRAVLYGARGDGIEREVCEIRRKLEGYFGQRRGFAPIERLNYIDGVRMTFANGEVAHLRPSGNADEFRIYAVADTQTRAEQIAALGIAEPDGILREIERSLARH